MDLVKTAATVALLIRFRKKKKKTVLGLSLIHICGRPGTVSRDTQSRKFLHSCQNYSITLLRENCFVFLWQTILRCSKIRLRIVNNCILKV